LDRLGNWLPKTPAPPAITKNRVPGQQFPLYSRNRRHEECLRRCENNETLSVLFFFSRR